MSAYRFCRTDDITLLVEALRRCWWPYARNSPEPTVASFKREIRDLQVWCSSCMVAFDGAEPVGVLIGAKRPQATLLHRLAVHPDHLRRGHGRHLVSSLVSKLAILGPPRIVAEVPEALIDVRALLHLCGFVEEAVLSDYVLDAAANLALGTGQGFGQGRSSVIDANVDGAELLTIPVTVPDLEANGAFGVEPRSGWARGLETLRARRQELRGVALVADDRIQAYALWMDADGSGGTDLAILRAVGSLQEAPRLLTPLLARVRQFCAAPISIRGVHPDEFPAGWLAEQGGRIVSRVGLFARVA